MRWWFVLAIACGSPKPAPVLANRAAGSVASRAWEPPAHARLIMRTSNGGVIQLDGDRGKAMERSQDLMVAHCGPDNFTIIQEGEERVDEDVPRGPTAWRVHYQCGS